MDFLETCSACFEGYNKAFYKVLAVTTWTEKFVQKRKKTLSMFQSLTVRSAEPDARRVPSRLKERDHTLSLWPVRVFSRFPVLKSHRWIFPSAPEFEKLINKRKEEKWEERKSQTSRCKYSTVGRERQGVNSAVVARKYSHAFSCLDVPESDGLIRRSSGYIITIWVEFHALKGSEEGGGE